MYATALILLASGMMSLSAQSSSDYTLASYALAVLETSPPHLSSTERAATVEAPTIAPLDINAAPLEATFPNVEGYLAEHIGYPEVLRKEGVAGVVRLVLTISAEGSVEAARVAQSLEAVADNAAIAAVLAMPYWSPARLYGQPAPSRVTVEVKFGL